MIDINKKYTTRDGREVVIYAVYDKGKHPVHGAILEENTWICYSWTIDGKASPIVTSYFDLIEVQEPPDEFVGWLTFYQSNDPTFWMDIEDAKRYATRPIARKRITIQYREGEFDE